MNSKVTIPCRTIRRMAWQVGKNYYWECVFIVLCCTILNSAPVFIAESFTDNEILLDIIDIASFILETILNLGIATVFISVFRGKQPKIDMISNSFDGTLRTIGMSLLSSLLIGLKMLLLIVPGILQALDDALIFQVRSDNPDLAADECLKRSAQIMRGNRGKYILLNLSFFGWFLLAELPSYIYAYFFGPQMPAFAGDTLLNSLNAQLAYMNALAADPICNVLRLFTILVQVYLLMSVAAFYDLAAGNVVIQEGE